MKDSPSSEFYSQIAERQNLAKATQGRKRGTKSKKCTVPSDRLTEKQLRGLNGKVMSYHLSKPMRWQEFILMPMDIQEEYIMGLRKAFYASATDLMQMFGVSWMTIRNYIQENFTGFPITQGGRHKTAAERDAWLEFVDGCLVVAEKSAPVKHSAIDRNPPPAETTVDLPKMKTTNFSICYSGHIDPIEMTNSLRSILGVNNSWQVEITCTLKGEN